MSLIAQLRKLPGITKGIFAAMGFLGAAPQIVPYSALEIVSLLHAVIIGWNAIMSSVWGVISRVIPLPTVAPEIISAAVLGFSLSSTWAYSIFISERGQHQGFVQNAAFWTRIAMALFDGPIFLMLAFAIYPHPLFWVAILALAATLITSLARLPRFRAGFLMVIGFLGCLEAVYLLSTDAARDSFDAFVCSQHTIGLPQCDNGQPI